ncbi:carboxylating nicotinate-nucleotide diphosphorylase [Methanobrevibacter sp. DSM 116169]|uniref:carboxylating nicotinate-nucleotide diphosphorylase n=1 Tax=Methanobrevibacter sp. DSM 116169 TaxID=3242727 RepID=UPI0038FD2098
MMKIIEYMLEEDEGFGDITSNILINDEKEVIATIKSKDQGIFAGSKIIQEIFNENNIEILELKKDSTKINKGDLLFKIKGNALKILLLERTVLNIAMRMSGVATYTNNVVNKVKKINPKCTVAGTRKTSPAIAKFDKMAISIGGADPHRFALDDMVLIKDNHIAIVGNPLKALKIAKSKISFSKKIEIEVETLNDAIECVQNGADIVMLDNMSPTEIKEVLNELSKLNIRDKILIEVSGGINNENIEDYALLDVDIISLGALTHSSGSLNFSLNIEV